MNVQVLLNGLIAAGPVALVALGLSLVFSVERLFHLAHALVFTFAAYAAFALQLWGLPRGLSLCIAVVAATALGTGIEVAVYAPMRRSGASTLVMLVASLGIVVLGQGCVSLAFGSQTLSLRSTGYSASHQICGAYLTTTQLVSVAISGALCVGIVVFMRCTRAGLLIRAVASDAGLASIVGVPRERVTFGAFAIASAAAAVSGMLVAFDTDLTPMMGFNILLPALTAAVIGGLGSILGSIVGALLIGVAWHLIGWFLPTQWQDAAVFLVLGVCLLGRPQGLWGRPLRKVTI